jgi:hypothetical protein
MSKEIRALSSGSRPGQKIRLSFFRQDGDDENYRLTRFNIAAVSKNTAKSLSTPPAVMKVTATFRHRRSDK